LVNNASSDGSNNAQPQDDVQRGPDTAANPCTEEGGGACSNQQQRNCCGKPAIRTGHAPLDFTEQL
jgi:hypothetical protein